jgi:hypothetical protein
MKKTTLLAAAFATSALAQGASAGSLADPVIEAPIIIEDVTNSSSGTALIGVLAILLFAASAAD